MCFILTFGIVIKEVTFSKDTIIEKNIYSSTVLKYNFGVLVLHKHSEGNVALFIPIYLSASYLQILI